MERLGISLASAELARSEEPAHRCVGQVVAGQSFPAAWIFAVFPAMIAPP
jgi:hypothetical protein